MARQRIKLVRVHTSTASLTQEHHSVNEEFSNEEFSNSVKANASYAKRLIGYPHTSCWSRTNEATIPF